MPKLPLGDQVHPTTKLARRIRKRPYIALGITAVVAAIIGGVIGSWATCGQQCRFDTDLFAAVGTWVGGIATAAAFGITAQQLIASRRREIKVNDLRAQEAHTRARDVACRFMPVPDIKISSSNAVKSVKEALLVDVYNSSRVPITYVRVILNPSGKEVGQTDQINGVKENEDPTPWGIEIPSEDLEMANAPARNEDKIWLEFTMEGYRFRWSQKEGTVLIEREGWTS